MDPQEDLNVAGLFGRIGASTLRGSIGHDEQLTRGQLLADGLNGSADKSLRPEEAQRLVSDGLP